MKMFVKSGLTLALALPALFAGCAGMDDEANEFRSGVPRHEEVALAFPGGGPGQALTADGTSTTSAALLGARADSYALTRGITVMVNGATVWVLGLVKAVTSFPPTEIGADVAVWGPHTEALSPTTWRLTVRRTAPGEFDYQFEAKDKTRGDDAFLKVLSGHHVVAGSPMAHRRRDNVPDYGSGTFLVDWNASQMLPADPANPERDTSVGTGNFTYSRLSPTADVNIDVVFTQVHDDETGMLIDATYDYTAKPGGGGNFQFTSTKNAIATTAALETLSFRSRWQETGAGRTDIKLQGGDLAATPATANECWDTTFNSVYMTNSYGDAAKMWGAEASCVFATPEYASLI